MASAVLDGAVDLARSVAVEAAGDAEAVGEHRGVREDEPRVATHTFACELPGYRGWVWEVTLAHAEDSHEATVCEAALVPADDALLAPPWVPYADRLQPGDLEPSMVLPFIAEDPRLVPGYALTDDADADAVAIWELGLGRERVLGVSGRDEAVERWYRGSHGPAAPAAVAAAAPCATCAFVVPLSGSMRTMFGVCTNAWSPSDGQVVSFDHGCGAHSQTDLDKQSARWPADDPVIDTMAVETVELVGEEQATEASDGEASTPTDEA